MDTAHEVYYSQGTYLKPWMAGWRRNEDASWYPLCYKSRRQHCFELHKRTQLDWLFSCFQLDPDYSSCGRAAGSTFVANFLPEHNGNNWSSVQNFISVCLLHTFDVHTQFKEKLPRFGVIITAELSVCQVQLGRLAILQGKKPQTLLNSVLISMVKLSSFIYFLSLQ